MSRILGLDLGTNSIGWAIIDKETNNLLNSRMILKGRTIKGQLLH
jgi:CRISPR/Cas system Type II protein with McrA/HNH and RuvC-like nuclease domain